MVTAIRLFARQAGRKRAGALPLVGVKACGLLRCAPALRVTPTSPVVVQLGSSGELPSAMFELGLRPRDG